MSILADKSYKFAIRIVKLHAYLTKEQKEYTLSKQLLRSGTAIGALVAEAQYAQSKADFINKMYVSLKEANESRYWIRLLTDCNYLTEMMSKSIFDDVEELIKMLTSSINTTKESINA
ncbi:MAG TPA: four helix bundle protein [Sulfurovum sp.]|jgi:four helix bundle protein|nr:MAG: four helix bundle protein [Sulfurovum sp. 35-42-20]OYZ26868.1 MAG: four helix bundle protein [Sulfurovum sp. 16-42-52]OYZ49896.1 MAG: four helix bundle protein [Sulfurovum sp. 24-42-9]OZA45867.1 MAG: four helix bundle protein [Sulfurovum sp. 17-42-90]OZA60200.1 MAG: four helix bundle protein [Sulfurovum sp. 39-42-12]HQS72729.1 four helix bundle protein [Sulfurovum sp.]